MIHFELIFYAFSCSIASVISDQLFATLWTVAHQAPLSMGFSRQEYWSGLPCHPSRDLPYPGIEPASPALQADSSLLSHYGNPSVTIRMRLLWVYFVCFVYVLLLFVFCLWISNYSSTICWKDIELFLYFCKKIYMTVFVGGDICVLYSVPCASLKRLWGDIPHPRSEKPQQDGRPWSSGKMAVWEGLTNNWEKRSERQRRKGKIYPFEWRVPKNSKER